MALVPTPDREGYWLIGADGSVYAFGDAKYEGGAVGQASERSPSSAAAAPDGGGYWLVTANGQVMAFGDAQNYGSVSAPFSGPGRRRSWPLPTAGATGSRAAPEPSSTSATRETYARDRVGLAWSEPIVAMAATPDGGGYWLAAADGTVFSFGDAPQLATSRRASSPLPWRASPSPRTAPEPGSPSRTAPC